MGVRISITRDTESTRIFDLRKIVSKRFKRLLLGGGFITTSPSPTTEDRAKYLLEINSAYDLFNTVEESISEREKGNQLVAVIPASYKGTPAVRLDYIDMDGSHPSYGQNGDVIFARTSKKLVEYGDASFSIQQIWTLTKMTTRVNMLAPYGGSKDISVGEFNSRVPEFLREPETWDYSDLGRIPLINFTNTPSLSGTDEADLAPVAELQNLIDAATQAVFKELRNNSTRVISQGTNNRKMYKQDGSINFDLLNSDLFVSLGKQKNIDPTQAQNLIEILQGDPKLEAYGNFVSWAIDMGVYFAGLASQGDSDANRTSAGTIFTKTGDVETTRFKRQLREDAYKDLMQLMIEVDERWNFTSYDDKEVSITIKENKVFDDQFKLDKLQVGAELQLWTQEEMISLLKDTDDESFIENNLKQIESQKVELEAKSQLAQANKGNNNGNNNNNSNNQN